MLTTVIDQWLQYLSENASELLTSHFSKPKNKQVATGMLYAAMHQRHAAEQSQDAEAITKADHEMYQAASYLAKLGMSKTEMLAKIKIMGEEIDV